MSPRVEDSDLQLPNPIYDPYELDPRDPFYDEPYGGLNEPDDAWYKAKHIQLHYGRKFVNYKYSTAVLIKGFKLTPREFDAMDLKVKAKMFDMKTYEIPDYRMDEKDLRRWPAKQYLLNQEPIRTILHEDKTNGYFVMNALQGWLKYANAWITKYKEDLTKGTPPSVIERSWARPEKFKNRPESGDCYLNKHCFLRITPISESGLSVMHVPYTAFMQLGKTGDEGLDIRTTTLSALEEFLTEAGYIDLEKQILQYTKEHGDFLMDTNIQTDTELQMALFTMSVPGSRLVKLQVAAKDELSAASPSTAIRKKPTANKGREEATEWDGRGRKRKAGA